MDDWLRSHLVCPRDRGPLDLTGTQLVCENGHLYPVFDGIPVMLVDDAVSTHGYLDETLEQVSLNIDGEAKRQLRPIGDNRHGVDAFVQGEVPYTSGSIYFAIQHKLTRYPIPKLPLPRAEGTRFLDIGCNWGRWSIAAAQSGYRPVGIDPSLDAVLAARRVCDQLGVRADFVVADARFLPFADRSFSVVYSYGVFQHLSKANARLGITELRRVLDCGGRSLVQMPNRRGVRQYQQHRRRGFTEGEGFEVRYWIPSELLVTFQQLVGPSTISADCFFGLGVQASDGDLFPFRYRMLVRASQSLTFASRWCRPMRLRADSLFVESIRSSNSEVLL